MRPALFLLLLAAGHSHGWRYLGQEKPEGWPGMCIDGQKQSPIDLVTETAQTLVVEPLEFFNFKSLNGTLTNNGHSIAIHFDEDHCDSGVTGGQLKSLYILHEMHFHWDSEHTVNGKRFPLELHLVHYNSKYEDFKHAVLLHPPDALSVVGVLFYESENGTESLNAFLDEVKKVAPKEGAKERLPPHFNPIEFLPENTSTFFRYSGSLTTPPCSEIVTWTIMQTMVPISADQIEIFKQVMGPDSDKLQHNYRRLQDIGERKVFLMTDNGAKIISSVFCVLAINLLVVVHFR